jgi:hypothetical protein
MPLSTPYFTANYERDRPLSCVIAKRQLVFSVHHYLLFQADKLYHIRNINP